MKKCLLVMFFLFCSVLVTFPAWAYGPPEMNDALTEVVDLRGHGTIILQAIDILRNDGFQDQARFYTQYLLPLYRGAYQADQGGSFEYLGVTLGRNYFSHFHEISTGKGFYLTPVYSAIEGISFDWKVSTMRGPHASGADMCNYYYARAVEELRGNNVDKALEYLGYALHILADLTVPHHATNIGAHQDRLGETPGGRKTTHGIYEDAVDEALRQNKIPHATFGGIYHLDWTPGEYAIYAASQSAPHIGAIKYQDSGPAHFVSVARIMVPMAERLSAGLLHRFFEKWKDEDFSVVALQVTRVKALGSGMKRLDYPDQADFYIKVRLGTRQFPTSGVIEGGDDVDPNVLSEYNWFYPLWVGNRTATIPVEISLWDDDAASGDDHADIDPGGGSDLDFNLNLGNGEVSGDIEGTITRNPRTFLVSGSNSSQTNRAQITFTLVRHPYYAPGTGPDLLALIAPTQLSGSIRDSAGRPLADATVTILDTEFTTQSGADGAYLFPDLSALFSGDARSLAVRIQVTKDGYEPREVSTTLTRNASSTRNITLSALPSTRLRILLRDKGGQNVVGATVELPEVGIILQDQGNGEYSTSLSQEEPNKQYTLHIQSEDYQEETRTLTLRKNVTNTFSIVLTPLTSEDEGQEWLQEETGPTVSGQLFSLAPSHCRLEAAGPIAGWFWLRGPGHTASFTFEPPGRIPNVASAALNFVFLVTNRANGGSGFTTRPQVQILDSGGRNLASFTLHLINPFRPRCESDTRGAGYETRGALESPLFAQLLAQGRSFTVRIAWPFPGGMHLAATCGSVSLAYVTGGTARGRYSQEEGER